MALSLFAPLVPLETNVNIVKFAEEEGQGKGMGCVCETLDKGAC